MLWDFVVWVWSADPPVVTLICLAWVLSIVAVFLVDPRWDWRRTRDVPSDIPQARPRRASATRATSLKALAARAAAVRPRPAPLVASSGDEIFAEETVAEEEPALAPVVSLDKRRPAS